MGEQSDPLSDLAELVLSKVRESSSVSCAVLDRSGALIACNDAFARALGRPATAIAGAPLSGFLVEGDAERLPSLLQASDGSSHLLNFIEEGGSPFTLECRIAPLPGGYGIAGEPLSGSERSLTEELLRLNNELAVLSREAVRRNRELTLAKRKLEEALAELERTHGHLRRVQEVLPICMECGRVKSESAEWQDVVTYLKENEVMLSHGYCPSCQAGVLKRLGLE